MALDVRGFEWGGEDGTPDSPWPEGCITPAQMIKIFRLFKRAGSNFLSELVKAEYAIATDDNHACLTPQQEKQDAFTMRTYMMTLVADGLAKLATGERLDQIISEYDTAGMVDARACVSVINTQIDAVSVFGIGLELSDLLIPKAEFVEWLELHYGCLTHDIEKPGEQQFSQIMREIKDILDLGIARGPGRS